MDIGLVLFFLCLWTLQKDNLANISSLDRAILIRNLYLYARNSKERNGLEIFAGDQIKFLTISVFSHLVSH